MEDFFLNTVGVWLVHLMQGNPMFMSFIMVLGLLRMVVKPAMTIIQAVVKFTPYDSDDKWLADLEVSKGYKLFTYMLDWLLSIKMPEKK